GTRKLALACAGRPATVRRVDVAAGETAHAELKVAPIPVALTTAPSIAPLAPRITSTRTLGLTWASTSLLAAGTLGLGVAALVESSQLDRLKRTFPVSAA